MSRKLLSAMVPLLMAPEMYHKPKNLTLYVANIDLKDIPKEKVSKRQKRRARFIKNMDAK